MPKYHISTLSMKELITESPTSLEALVNRDYFPQCPFQSCHSDPVFPVRLDIYGLSFSDKDTRTHTYANAHVLDYP